MSYKSFNMCVILDILDVSCPGVCICPKGMVYLDIRLFGCNTSTSYVEPKFPLAFNERFSFHKNFAELTNLKDIQTCLEEKLLFIELVQVYKEKQITLATYKNNVDEVLYPERRLLSRNGEIAIFMKNEPFFPGTISPKITLVTKTSVTEQIIAIPRDDYCSSPYLETQCQPNRMKRVHHDKSPNHQSYRKKEHRISSNESRSTDTDSDTDNQLYCRRKIKTNNKMDCGCNLNKTKYCEDTNRMKINGHINKSSNQKYIKIPMKLKNKLDDNEYKNIEITSNKNRKNIKAILKVGAHHNKCCKSRLNRNSSSESIKSSDNDLTNEEKCIRQSELEINDSGEEPRKINPKIKLHFDVHHNKCGVPNYALSPSWRTICHEVNKRDTIGDTIKYNVSLRNYYRRLYDGATYQLGRNLKLL